MCVHIVELLLKKKTSQNNAWLDAYHKLYNYFFIKGGVKLKGKALFVLVLLLLPYASSQTQTDIYISNFEVYPEEIYEGDQVRVNITVVNDGDEYIDNLCITLFVDEPTNVVDEIYVSIDANGETNVNLYWIAEKGEHILFIFADCEGAIDEINEDNNIVSIPITVKEPVYPIFPPSPENAEWWNGNWHYRVPVTVSMVGEREGFPYENKMVICNVNFTDLMEKIYYSQAGSFSKRTFYPASVRVIEYELKNDTWVVKRNVGREIILSNDYDAIENANVTILWVLEGNIRPHERRYYYIYWDTVENGHKNGEFMKIYSGIKNAEFEDSHSSQWKNVTEGPIKWEIGYVKDPIEHDMCYVLSAKGLYGSGYIWANSYAKVYQNFQVPDKGQTYYILHAKVYVYTDLEDVTWKILFDGEAIDAGQSTGGWIEITKNVTSYLKGKGYVTISFKVEISHTKVETEKHEVYAYFDSCWIETPNIEYNLMNNNSHGWWASIEGLETSYIAGVEEKSAIESIQIKSVANPKEVVAVLYSPLSEVVKVSMPLPDPSFEEESYTSLFYSNERTSSARIQGGEKRSGSKAVELKLSNYIGKWPIQNRYVNANDTVGLIQNITYGMSLSNIPSLFFWYKIDKSSPKSYLEYTLLTIGSTPKSYKVYVSDLIKDGEWHKEEIPSYVLSDWRKSGGKIKGVEIKLVANAEGAENTIYIDDLGYSFTPKNAVDRTTWEIDNFYEFSKGTDTGKWRLDIILTDGSDYRIEKSALLDVDAAADLQVFQIDTPAMLKEGETGKFVVYVKNNGPKSINESQPINVTLSIYQEGGETYKMIKSIAGLAVSEIKKIDFYWKGEYGLEKYAGTWNAIAKINEKGDIPEWEMRNNWWHTSFDVEPRPDLKIDMEDVLFKPSNPSSNESFNISVIVHNIGYKNATAKIRIYQKKLNETKFILLKDGTAELFIAKNSWEKTVFSWKGEEGVYNIKIEVECDDEVNVRNNEVIKDIRIGKIDDSSPPVIEVIRAINWTSSLGIPVNISATIFDENTTIDKAYVVIEGENEKTYLMNRLSSTNIYYTLITFDSIGYYKFFIRALDTSNWQNVAESEEKDLRIVYEGIETNGPNITAITIDPPSARQVLFGKVNISVYIQDESGVEKALIFIERDGEEEEHEMKKGANNIYYYEEEYEKSGKYYFFIKAIDSSANANYNVSETFSFEIPEDYDMDGVPDIVEIKAGGNPKNASQSINVSMDNENGYLIWIEEDNKYIYWDKDDNQTRSVGEMDVDGDGNIDYLFDSNGDGKYDYYYNEFLNEVHVYKEKEEKKISEAIWILPPIGLFILICVVFIIIRKK